MSHLKVLDPVSHLTWLTFCWCGTSLWIIVTLLSLLLVLLVVFVFSFSKYDLSDLSDSPFCLWPGKQSTAERPSASCEGSKQQSRLFIKQMKDDRARLHTPQQAAALQVYVLLWSPNLPVTEKLLCRCIDSMSWSFDKEWKSQDKILGTTIKICTIKCQCLLVEIKMYFYVLYRELQLCVTLKKISCYIVCLGGFVRSVYLWMPFNKCLCFLDMIAAPPQHAWAQTDRRGKYWWATLSGRRD